MLENFIRSWVKLLKLSKVEVLFQQTRQKQALTSLNEAINGGKVTGAAKRKRGLEFDTMRSDNIGPGLSKRLKAIKTDRFAS